MQFSDFYDEITYWAKNLRPIDWRYGQAIFNYIEQIYGVSRLVQFKDHIDCFYSDDELICNEFIQAAWHYVEQNIVKE